MKQPICVFPSAPRFAALLLAAPLLAACISENDTNAGRSTISAQASQASFVCGDGETLDVRPQGGALLVRDSQDATARLDASPPGQSSRYDSDGYALVLDGREALWMKAGQEPMTCRR